MKITRGRTDLKAGTYIYGQYGRPDHELTGDYDSFHGWYEAVQVEVIDQDGTEKRTPCVVTPSDLIGDEVQEVTSYAE